MVQGKQGSDQVAAPNSSRQANATLELTPEETNLIQFVREHAPPDYATNWYEKLQGLTLNTATDGRVCFIQNRQGQIVPIAGAMAGSGSP